MMGGRTKSGWPVWCLLGASTVLFLLEGCREDACKALDPQVQITVDLAGSTGWSAVDHMEVSIGANGGAKKKASLTSGDLPKRSFVYQLPPGTRDLQVQVKLYAKDNTSLGEGGASTAVSSDGCNEIGVSIHAVGDAGTSETDGDGSPAQPHPVAQAWAFGGELDDRAKAVTRSASGNIYVTGAFLSKTMPVGKNIISSDGFADLFVLALSSQGQVRWAKDIGGAKQDEGRAIVTDRYENVYVAGEFSSPSISVAKKTCSHQGVYEDVFIVSYDRNGTYRWHWCGGSSGSDSVAGVALNHDDTEVCVVGEMARTGQQFSNDTYVRCFQTSNGTAGWNLAVAPNNGSNRGHGIAIDTQGSLYLTGHLIGSADFGCGPLSAGGATTNTAYLVKYLRGSQGTSCEWGKAIASEDTSGYARGAGMVIVGDSTLSMGKVFWAGAFEGQVPWSKQTPSKKLQPIGSFDMFVAEVDPTTGTISQAKAFGSLESDYFGALSVDDAGYLYLMAGVWGEVDLGSLPRLSSHGGQDLLIVRLDASLRPDRQWRWGGLTSQDSAGGLVVFKKDGATHLLAAGGFGKTATFGNAQKEVKLDAGSNNQQIFVTETN